MLDLSLQQLWLNAIALLPVAFVAAVICRWLPCRPSTRHAMWLAVLSMLIVPSLLLTVIPENILRNPLDSIKAVNTVDKQEPKTVVEKYTKPVTENKTLIPELESELPSNTPVYSTPSIDYNKNSKPRKTESKSKPTNTKVELNTVTSPYLKYIKKTDTNRRFFTPPTSNFTIPEKPVIKQDETSSSKSDEIEVKKSVIDLPDISATTEEVNKASTIISEFQSWAVQLLKLRDVAAAIPPLPTAIWMGGLLMVLWFLLLRISRVRRMIQTGKPAHESVNWLVRHCADRLNISTIPDAVMVSEAVSPMLWCGKQKTLIIPETLWKNLDNSSRMSVILHELAHMKRRDHWVCWLELIVSAVYWWNPLVWWIRKHIRDEADYACDAWVTQLLPRSRRAYAQALLESRKYTSTETLAGPVVGLGANGSHKRRFARRLTMVMTEQRTPGISRRGTALVFSLTIIGCLVAPIAACPPESQPEKQFKYKNVVITDEAPATQPSRKKKLKKQVETTLETAPTVDSTFEQFMQDSKPDDVVDAAPGVVTFTTRPDSPFMSYTLSNSDDVTEQRLEKLELRIESLMQMLQQLDLDTFDEFEVQMDVQENAKKAYQRALESFTTFRNEPASPFTVKELKDSDFTQYQQTWVANGGETISRIYHISAGKLKEITELMVREDVPILVTPKTEEGAIEVHATLRHHQIFEAFIRMIDPDGKAGHTSSFTIPASAILPVEIANILHQQDAKNARILQLNSVIQNLDAQQQQHHLHADSLEHQANILEDQIDSLIDHLEELEADDEELSREELQVRRYQVKSLRSQIKSMERVLRDCEKQAEEACERADDCCEDIDELQEEIEDIQSEEDED